VDATDSLKVSDKAFTLKQMQKRASRTLAAFVSRIWIPIGVDMLIPYERFRAAAGKSIY
jgi:hypothetical protein